MLLNLFVCRVHISPCVFICFAGCVSIGSCVCVFVYMQLRDPLASVEGRWAGGIQRRIDSIAVREAAQKHSGVFANKSNPASNIHISNTNNAKNDAAIVSAAASGAILPFSTHPVVTDPLRSVWATKKMVLDPSKTSAGLTQDLINWSKFDHRFDKHHAPAAAPAETISTGQSESAMIHEAHRREAVEVCMFAYVLIVSARSCA